MTPLPHITWQQLATDTITKLTPLLQERGFVLSDEQPHLKGERFLMQALTTVGGSKLILQGVRQADTVPVIIKVSNDTVGIAEIEHERVCRASINQLDFAYDVFAAPQEILHTMADGFVISIQEYIAQEHSFLERPLLEQFDYALRAFTAQEHSRATTGHHVAAIKKTFGLFTPSDYQRLFVSFVTAHQDKEGTLLHSRLTAASTELKAGSQRILQYGGFLTHTDFVPHNFRIRDNKLYLLDFSAIRFGNKHEGWARFLNFMTLHHPELETALLSYLEMNRAAEELESLHLMRLFRLGEIVTYYESTLPRSTGNLLTLNQARIDFWSDVLAAELEHTQISPSIRAKYQVTRDTLRSEGEKARQQGLL